MNLPDCMKCSHTIQCRLVRPQLLGEALNINPAPCFCVNGYWSVAKYPLVMNANMLLSPQFNGQNFKKILFQSEGSRST